MAILAVESPDAQRRETLPLNFDASSETLDLDRDRILEASLAVEATRRRELAPGGTRVPLLMSVDKVKFRRPARPGDQLRITATMLRLRSSMSACQAVITIDGERCAEGEIRCVMVDRSAGG